jgi:predicted alpha/beta-hydrolase family hydrolase/mannose-6-phosphate isomerase-like protein (cupin superfamily)
MEVLKLEKLPLSVIARKLVGADHALDITVLFVDAPPGKGPRLHRHPYDEVFIMQEGRASFTVGDEQVDAGPGEILVAHANEPHAFVNPGPGPLRQIDIHVSPTMTTEWLEEGERADAATAIIEVDTPHGLARAHLRRAEEPRAALVLGHGAAGGVESRDLVAVTEVAASEGVTVALVEQPYRVAGRRSPAPAPQLDAAWRTVVERLVAGELQGLPLVLGGRSLGARVACRTAHDLAAVAVLCLAFPLQPPRRAAVEPASRLPELDGVMVPTLVVQGERDPFGIPPAAPDREVVQVPGDHGLKTDLGAVTAAVGRWLRSVLARPAGSQAPASRDRPSAASARSSRS